MRIGIGNDVHKLVAGRDLVIGGINIPYEKGLLGHSDADVLTHAVCDALLGAAGLGDIGVHFPDSDPQYKDICSIRLLEATWEMVRQKKFHLGNIDMTIFAEAPKFSPYYSDIKSVYAKTLEIDHRQINIKATTGEGLGMIGKGEAIAAMCVALLTG